MAILKITDTAERAAESLGQKLGDDEAAAVLLATLLAAFQQAVLLYEDSEDRHRANLRGAASFLTRLGDNMSALDAELAAEDQAVADLHSEVQNKLLAAGDSVTSARRAMGDVLKIYNDFAGNTKQLKQGIASFAKATLAALNPTLGVWAGGQIDKLLRLS